MNIYESIAAIMAEGYAVSKDKKNQQQGFRYRGIDDVMNTFYPLLAQHKVFVVPEVLEQTREDRQTAKGGNLIYSVLKLRYTFYAEDGSNVSAIVIGEGMDSGDKASNKAMAVGMKYALFQVFCIPTEEMQDPDATTPEPSKPVSVPRPGEVVQMPTPANTEPLEGPDGYYYCDCCGNVITKAKNMTEYQVASLALQEFGKQMCFDCARKAYKARSGQ